METTITATKIKTIDVDNIKLLIQIIPKGELETFETHCQYNQRTNTCHHTDHPFIVNNGYFHKETISSFEDFMLDKFEISMEDICEDIEARKIQIN